MSDATNELHRLVRMVSSKRLKFPDKHPTVLAAEIIKSLPAINQDMIISSATLNGGLFIREAGQDRHKLALHQAVIHAVQTIKQETEKEAPRGISRTHPR